MYYWPITIDIGPTQIDVIAGFTEGMNSNGCGLLGRLDSLITSRFNSIFPAECFGLRFQTLRRSTFRLRKRLQAKITYPRVKAEFPNFKDLAHYLSASLAYHVRSYDESELGLQNLYHRGRDMPLSYENILRSVESLSRPEQLRLISDLAEYLRSQTAAELRTSILALQGLGKDTWQGMDAQEYVDGERASWNG